MITRILVAVFVLSTSFCTLAEDCTDALVKDTYKRIDVSKTDWRLASLVTEKEWTEASHDAEAHGVIYGIPVGASYADFQSRVTDKLNSYNESLSHDEMTNIAWTGLAPDSSKNYIACIEANSQGLQMYVEKATKDEVSVKVRWNATGSEPQTATPTWSWNGPTAKFPKQLAGGYTGVLITRPDTTRILQVNFQGHSSSIVITKWPTPPPPPEYTFVPCVETYQTPIADGWGDNWSPPVTFCTPDKPEGWSIARLVSWTTYDFGTGRSCSAWAHCTGSENDTNRRICRTIAVQGHNDNTHEGHGKLQGTMIVQWRQKLGTGEDPHKQCQDGTATKMF